MRKKEAYYLLSLGCPKNEVDSECMAALLEEAGYRFTPDPESARYLIVNTCAFIEPAIEEAIEAILDLASIKEAGDQVFLIVVGCLPQRFKEAVFDEFPEIDALLGTGEYDRITDVLKELAEGKDLRGQGPGPAGSIDFLDTRRLPTAPRGTYAYLKIAEGCSNACAYCTIPRLRGPQRSREPEAILDEAAYLAQLGIKELILVAQDTTRYGRDLPDQPTLASLLKRLSVEVEGLELIRCLYFYADAVTEDLIGTMADNPKLAPYIDLPIQHASDRILAAMRRRETRATITRKIDLIRRILPDVILRSTVITGFPGEGEEDFRQLLDFVKEIKFDRLGCFSFSCEEGTLAASLPDQVDPGIARQRQALVMSAQRSIALAANKRRIGQVTPVLLEGVEERGILFQGRSYGEAPDIDPVIYVAATTPDLSIGSRPAVRIVDAGPYELTGVTLDEYCE